MKKIVSLATALCSVLSASAMFVSCSKECEHVWDAGSITTPATLTTKGIKTYKCTECSETKTEEFEAVTTVTAEQWAAAFNLAAQTCKATAAASMSMEMGGATVNVSMVMDFIITDTMLNIFRSF